MRGKLFDGASFASTRSCFNEARALCAGNLRDWVRVNRPRWLLQ